MDGVCVVRVGRRNVPVYPAVLEGRALVRYVWVRPNREMLDTDTGRVYEYCERHNFYELQAEHENDWEEQIWERMAAGEGVEID